MKHTTGCLVNTATGDVIDAGVIFVHESEGVVLVMRGRGDLHQYTSRDFPSVAILEFEFCPN